MCRNHADWLRRIGEVMGVHIFEEPIDQGAKSLCSNCVNELMGYARGRAVSGGMLGGDSEQRSISEKRDNAGEEPVAHSRPQTGEGDGESPTREADTRLRGGGD